MDKLEVGSGGEDFWFWSRDQEAIRLDCDPYDGVTKWVCPDRMPVEDNIIMDCYVGQFLIECTIQDHMALALELNRVMKTDGKIRIHCYDGTAGFKDFFERMKELGWTIISEELVNKCDETETFMVTLRRNR